MLNIARKLFGSANDREIKRMRPIVERINALEPEFVDLDDTALAAKTAEFRKRHENGESLDKLLPEAFAAVREAAKRSLGQRHYDVQLMGGMVLHNSNIAEMRTGEGKTLVSTLAAYLNALPGKGVQITVSGGHVYAPGSHQRQRPRSCPEKPSQNQLPEKYFVGAFFKTREERVEIGHR